MTVTLENACPVTPGFHPGLLVIASEGTGRADLIESARRAIAGRGDMPVSSDEESGMARFPVVGSIAQLRGADLGRVEIVICAARLADGSGLEALEAVRERRHHVPVILAGGRADAGLAIPAIRAGANDFAILEPGDATGLVIAVEKCFAQQRMQRENDRLRDELRESLVALEVKNRELETVINQLEVKARTDALTGLANRRWLNLMLQGAWAEAARHDLALGCLMIDLDGLKALNDEAGHQRGDEVLQAAGRVIRENCREIDVKARFGGDEFCILMPHTEAHEAMMVAERLFKAFAAAARELATGRTPVGMSIGLAHRHLSHPAGAEMLVAHADEALYAAKAAGKSRVIVRDDEGVFAPMSRGLMSGG